MSSSSAVYILSGARTPVGGLSGALSNTPAVRLGAKAIEGALKRAKVEKKEVDEVFMGHVVQAGTGQAPARQASIFAGLDHNIPCTTINKVCGSGMKALICGTQSIMTGDNRTVVTGGMENMSMAPHLIMGLRKGIKFGHSELKDSMQLDGLWDVYSERPMGSCGEDCAALFKFSREKQDAFAIESFKRAQNAANEGIFKEEIVPVDITIKGKKSVVDQDEGPFKARFDKIPLLKPVFKKDGTITAANASTVNDGASAVVLGGEQYKNQAEFQILAHAGHAQDPGLFTTAPIEAMKKCAQKAGLPLDQIELFEINEAFAVVAMAAMEKLQLDHDKVNIYGGGISLGHPIGSSGSRIVVTLMTAMRRQKVRYGMASICIGGGEALSLIIERIR